MKKTRIHFTAAILFSGLFILQAQDWPQYQGPTRNGISNQKGIIKEWTTRGPEVLWTTDVGIGFGGPVIKDGKAYLLDRDDKTGDMVRCFDMVTGKELWSFKYDAPGSVSFPGSRSVPAIDENRLYTCGPYGDLYCIDINTHKPIWNKNIWTDFGGTNIPTWAISQCPLVYGDLLIIASQAPQAGVVAYNKLNGELKWKTAPVGGVGYVSPAVVKIGGEDQIVMISAMERSRPGGSGEQPAPKKGMVTGINPSTGEILWDYSGWQCVIPIASAFDAGEGRILITGGYRSGSVMLKVEKKAEGGYNVTELFKNAEFGAHTQPPVLYKGNFYAQCSTNESKYGLVCMGMDGQTKWKTNREPAFDKGGMIVADGLLICTDGLTKLYLVEPDPSAFRPIVSAELLRENVSGTENAASGAAVQNWAPIALSDGKLLIRNQKTLMCIKIAK